MIDRESANDINGSKRIINYISRGMRAVSRFYVFRVIGRELNKVFSVLSAQNGPRFNNQRMRENSARLTLI